MNSVFIEPSTDTLKPGIKNSGMSGYLVELPFMPRTGDFIEVMAATIDLDDSIDLSEPEASIFTAELKVTKVRIPEHKSPTKTLPGLSANIECTLTKLFSMNETKPIHGGQIDREALHEHRKEEAEIGNI